MTAAPPDARRYGHLDTSYRAAGGLDGIRRLVDRFYDHMDSLPEARAIRAMHAPELTASRDKLACFLCGWLGGPRRYSDTYGPISIPGVHRHLSIGAAERDAWLRCMQKAIAEQPYDEAFKVYLLRQLAIPAERVRQTSRAAVLPPVVTTRRTGRRRGTGSTED